MGFISKKRKSHASCLLPLVNNCFSLSSFFQSLLYFLWIGAQFPQVKFLSYGRILTLHYYFLLLCILFSSFFLFFYVIANLLFFNGKVFNFLSFFCSSLQTISSSISSH